MIFILGIKTALYLKYNRITGLVEKRNSQLLVLHERLRCGSLSIIIPVSLLANELDIRIVELGSCQSNLCNSWGYERLQKSKDSLKDCFENVNIYNSNTPRL